MCSLQVVAFKIKNDWGTLVPRINIENLPFSQEIFNRKSEHSVNESLELS
jgi:hypothetical protein